MLSQEPKGHKILIALEGSDYTGKSTLAARLVERINKEYKTLAFTPAVKVSRPGGTMECAHLRSIITNSELPDSTVRQSFAIAEEVLFKHTFKTDSPIVIFDRYNPISGQIYGPLEMCPSWQELVIQDLTFKMDKTIFIDSDKEDIVKRASDREKLDVMDNVFLNKMDYVLSNYRSIINWDWTQKYCNPVSLMNNDFEQLVDQAYAIIEEVISQQDWN